MYLLDAEKEPTMSQTLDLKELERKVWTSYLKDGLWDIYFGSLLLAGAVSSWFSYIDAPDGTRIPAYLTVMALGMIALMAGKRFITVPRLGRAKFSRARETRRTKITLIIMVAVIVTAGLLMAGILKLDAFPEQFQPFYGAAVIATLLLVVFGSMAYFWQFKRLYLYAALFALPEIVGVTVREFAGTDVGFFITNTVGAAIMLGIGGVVFTRFLRDYPLLTEGPRLEGNAR
jgi:hypothetical protein